MSQPDQSHRHASERNWKGEGGASCPPLHPEAQSDVLAQNLLPAITGMVRRDMPERILPGTAIPMPRSLVTARVFRRYADTRDGKWRSLASLRS